MRGIRWIFLFCLSGIRFAIAQEYSYTHYDVAEGLPSSTVYCITQDKAGFIWAGTEAGLCRFDGTHFRTYTSADGLPDAEVLQLFGDSKGRVWMAPFGGSVCYYFQGRIHNTENDSMLNVMRLHDNSIENFAEDAEGNILIQEKAALHVVGVSGLVRNYDSVGGRQIDSSAACGRSLDGHFTVQIGEKIFELSDQGFSAPISIHLIDPISIYWAISPSWAVWRTNLKTATVRSLVSGMSVNIPFTYPKTLHVSYSIVGDSELFQNEFSGTLEYNLPSGRIVGRFLPGRKVSKTFRDQAGNLWFTTLGSGLFRLNSEVVRTIHFQEEDIGVSSICGLALNLAKDQLLVGDNHNVVFFLAFPCMNILRRKELYTIASNRVLFIRHLGGNQYFVGSDAWIAQGRLGDSALGTGKGIKAVCMMDDHRILIGGFWGAGVYDPRIKRLTDTLWRSRVTALYRKNDTIYIGTLRGLWRIIGSGRAQFMGNEADFLRSRISALAESKDGILWVATYDKGLVGYFGGRVISTFGKDDRLEGNVVHSLLLQDSILWTGTDKGLNKIELNRPGHPIATYTSSDGLASDVVNVIYASGDTILVGTSAGLSYFDERKLLTVDECRLNLISAISSGHDRLGQGSEILLPFRENNIRFEFVAISYRSVGKVTYRYRLKGLDSVWRETKDNYLAYPTLPSGNYEFQLQAVNRFGRMSELRALPFIVETPWRDRNWFRALALVGFLAVTWSLAWWWIRRDLKRQDQKAMQTQRMAELEYIALQSQMNPHFIFNCLNSIQQFVFDKDMVATNEYISGFARLIRATLNNSTRSFITVAEEIEYLSDYLSLEKMRFKSKMDFRIEIDPSVDIHHFLLPPMMLQPYVENSVRHGIRHKQSGDGLICIHFHMEGELLKIIVQDNGIGRKNAMGYKTKEHIEYQSKGMSLTSSRIQMVKLLYKTQVDVLIEDLASPDGQAAGTRIVVLFPRIKEWPV